MNYKKTLLVSVLLVVMGFLVVQGKNDETVKGKKTVNLEEYNRKTEVNILTMDLHERVKKEGTKFLDNLSGVELPTDDLTKKEFLSFINKRKSLRDLHSKVSPTYEKAQELEKTNKKESIKLYDQTLDIFRKGKNSVASDDVYVLIDMANIHKTKSTIYADLKDTKNQEASLQNVISTYDQAIISYKKNPKNYDDGSDPDLNIGKTLQYEKSQAYLDIANLKKIKSDKKKLYLEALDSYKEMLKYNTSENCDAGCVMVDSEKIKEIYLKIKE